jgi:hypothetical protein
LAAHIENVDVFTDAFMPLFFNYFEYARQLRREAPSEGLVRADFGS